MSSGLHTRVVSEKEVTIDFIVNEATSIWKELQARGIPRDDHAGSKQFHKEMRKSHPEFAKSYALVLRYIVEMRIYSPKVFAKWLKQVQARPHRTSDEYMESQANYIMMLYANANPKSSAKDRYAVRNNVKELLTKEYEDFQATTKKYEAIVNERDQKLAEQNKADLLNYCVNAPTSELAAAGSIRVEVDEAVARWSTVTVRPATAPPLMDLSADDLLG